MSDIVFTGEPFTALAYQVIAHLDLGRDAASLYDPALPSRAWTERLLHTYLRAPGRLALHAIPLVAFSESKAWDLLSRSRALADSAGQALARGFLEALRIEQPAFDEAWRDDRGRTDRARTAAAALMSLLTDLRAALYDAPPSLVVLDCPALGSNGRACWDGGARRVAVSLSQPLAHTACQILHEEAHAVSDPAVRARQGDTERDTRAGSAGHAAHMELEREAMALGARAIAEAAPSLTEAYATWCARFGMRPDGTPRATAKS